MSGSFLIKTIDQTKYLIKMREPQYQLRLGEVFAYVRWSC